MRIAPRRRAPSAWWTTSERTSRSQGAGGRKAKGRYWSAAVTTRSNALDLEPGVFTWSEPRRIARSLLRSAEQSSRRKAPPYRSAMSMLTFYINRAGRRLPATQRRVLEQAKVELRREHERGAS